MSHCSPRASLQVVSNIHTIRGTVNVKEPATWTFNLKVLEPFVLCVCSMAASVATSGSGAQMMDNMKSVEYGELFVRALENVNLSLLLELGATCFLAVSHLLPPVRHEG